MHVEALFTDLDGTLIPPDVSREDARLTSRLHAALSRLSEELKLAVITTKDYHFASRLVPFAHAWATIGGLEITTRDNTSYVEERVLEKQYAIGRVLSLAEELASGLDRIVVERKLLRDRVTLAGLAFDWRLSGSVEKAVEAASLIEAEAKAHGLHVMRYPGRPYLDVFAAEIDKGKALRRLREILNIGGAVIYMGDSEADNPAFREAEISIGIIHSETPKNLEAKHTIPFNARENFLEALQTSRDVESILREMHVS